MRIETYIPGLSKNTVEIIKHAESLGYDALVSGELNNEPFLPVLVGLEHSKKMIVRTGLAIAFPRSPMTVANMGWDLQSFSPPRRADDPLFGTPEAPETAHEFSTEGGQAAAFLGSASHRWGGGGVGRRGGVVQARDLAHSGGATPATSSFAGTLRQLWRAVAAGERFGAPGVRSGPVSPDDAVVAGGNDG